MNERQKRERDRQRKEQLEKHLKRQRDAIEKIREMAQLDTFIERGLDDDEGDNGNEQDNDVLLCIIFYKLHRKQQNRDQNAQSES